MSKELIERLALEAWVNATLEDLSPEAVFKRGYCDAMRSIAERGKEAVAVIDFSVDGWRLLVDSLKAFPDGTQLFLAPQIPKGMVQRNPEPYLICGDIAVSNDPRYAGWVFVRHVNGKDWTTGAKLTPETWQMIAAAGEKP